MDSGLAGECRVRVWLDGLQLDYRAGTADVAFRFAHALTGIGARVDVDQEMTPELRPLPCEQLWAWPDTGELARMPAAS